jgi:hypothetical protein
MSSNIFYDDIDENFPVQGQDNLSKGFRENFKLIKNGLNAANIEITDLQEFSALKNQNNNFNGKIIENAILKNICNQYQDNGIIIGNFSINVIDSQIQKLTFASDATLNFTRWPSTGTIGKNYHIKLHLLSNKNVACELVFGTEYKGPNTNIKYHGFQLNQDNNYCLTLPISGVEKVIEAWTYDGGVTVFLNYIGEFV